MPSTVLMTDDTESPGVIHRLENLEKQVDLINMKLQPEAGLPGFEFYIEADGEEIWSGQDLQNHYPEIMKQHPDKELVINWRSFSVTLV